MVHFSIIYWIHKQFFSFNKLWCEVNILVEFTITWHTHTIEMPCPFCRPLNNMKWIYRGKEVASMTFPSGLSYPGLGQVWDFTADEPRTHGINSRRGPWNCRCWLTYTFNTRGLGIVLNSLRRAVEGSLIIE